MDYFSELLDSYDKLKKRTFKLRYISEAEEDATEEKDEIEDASVKEAATKLANSYIKDAKAIASSDKALIDQLPFLLKVDKTPTTLKIFKNEAQDGKTSVYGLGKGQSPLRAIADKAGVVTDQDAYDEFLNILGSDEKTTGSQQAVIGDEEQRKKDEEAERERIEKEMNTLGGWSRLQGKPLSERTIAALTGAKEEAEKYCKNNENEESISWLCSRINNYFVAGNSGMGIEYKLGTAQGLSVTDPELGLTKKSDLTSVEKEQVALSYEFLLGFLGDPGALDPEGNPEKCKDVTNRIGIFTPGGGQLVLFGDERDSEGKPNRGVVVGKQNQLQKAAMQAIKTQCGTTEDMLSQLAGDGFDNQTKNAVKGTFFEEVLVYSGRIRMAKTDAERKYATDKIKETLRDKKRELLAVFRDLDPEDGQSLESQYDLTIQQEALDLLSDEEELREFMMREIRATAPWIDFMGAQDIIHGGLVSKTGQRADINFSYSDQAMAEEKAAFIGSTAIQQPATIKAKVEEEEVDAKGVPVLYKSGKKKGEPKMHKVTRDVPNPDAGKWFVGMGLKRLSKIKGPKFGEINTQERLDSIVGGLEDRFIAEGFQESMRVRQFGNKRGEKAERKQRQDAMVAFSKNLTEEVDAVTDQLIKNKTYVDADGKIKVQRPAGIFGTLGTTIMKTLDFASLGSVGLATAFFSKDKKGNSIPKDYTGNTPEADENKQRGKEIVARSVRARKVKTAINDDSDPVRQKAARDYVIRTALITGSNSDNMSQLVVDDAGTVINFKHNEVFDIICKANNDPNSAEPIFTFDDSSIKIKVGNISVTVGQEMAKVIDKDGTFVSCDTRTECKIGKSTLENKDLQAVLPAGLKGENNSSFEEYIKGHIKLLETFLS